LKILFKIFIFLFCFKSFSQEDFKDTVWLSNKWEESIKSKAKFYRVYKNIDKGFLVFDRYLNGNNYEIFHASQIKPSLKYEGYSVCYNIDGTKSARGFFNENKKRGIWTQYFDGEKDSSVYEVMDNGKAKYIYKSPLQKEEIYTIVENPAEFRGGVAGLMKFIQENIKYPEIPRDLTLGGKAFLKFVIDEDGYVNNCEILKSTGVKQLDEEALRVVKIMPQWTPASMMGVNVKCYFNLPINFSMTEPYFIFNTFSKNEKYILANNLVLNQKYDEALKLYNEDTNNAESWYNMAVIYFIKKNKKESKNYFENVNKNITDTKNQYYVASKKFLDKNF